MKVIQFSAGFNEGDAISNIMMYYRDKFIEKNISSEIYSQNIGYSTSKLCKKFNTYSYTSNDIIIYHHSIHSKIYEFLKSLPNKLKKIIIYHNVTPHEYIKNYDLSLAYYLQKGREELKEMSSFFDINIAVSEFNKVELDQIGFKNVFVIPINISKDNYKIFPQAYSDLFKILFVGRIAPNKKQCDLIRIAKILSNYNFPFKLILAGKTAPELLSYKQELDYLIKYFELDGKVEFLNYVTQENICELYSNADLFLCMSEHEGFCVPLLEAMYYQLPIIAYKAGAIPETLGEGGILFKEKKLDYIAEMIHKIKIEDSFRKKIIKKGSDRFKELNSFNTFDSLMNFIN